MQIQQGMEALRSAAPGLMTNLATPTTQSTTQPSTTQASSTATTANTTSTTNTTTSNVNNDSFSEVSFRFKSKFLTIQYFMRIIFTPD